MEYLQEFPLVFFTLLVQMAVGMVLVGKCVLGNEADRALREGVRRQNVVKDGVRVDVVLLGMTKAEWLGKRPTLVPVIERISAS